MIPERHPVQGLPGTHHQKEEENGMKKGLAVSIFVLGILMTGISITTMILGAVGMGKSRAQ